MIVLDRDVLVKLRHSNRTVIAHLQQYRTDEWTIPSHVAWESSQCHGSRTDRLQELTNLQSSFDRILPFTVDTALEAAYLDEKLRSQGVALDAVDLLNLATAHESGARLITQNKRDFDRSPVRDIADIDIVLTE